MSLYKLFIASWIDAVRFTDMKMTLKCSIHKVITGEVQPELQAEYTSITANAPNQQEHGAISKHCLKMRRLMDWICSRTSEWSRGTHYKELPLTSTSVCEIVCTRYPFVLRQALDSHKLLFQCRSLSRRCCSISDLPQLNESFSIAGVEPNGYRLLCQDLGSTSIPERWEDHIKIFSKSSWCEIPSESRYGLSQRCQHGRNRKSYQ